MSNGNRRTDLRRGSIDLKQLVSDPETMIDAEGKLSIPQGSMTSDQLAVLEKLVVAMQSTDNRTWANLKNLVTFLAGQNIVDPTAGSINILTNDSQTDDKIQLGTEAKPFYNIVTNSINVLDSNSIYLAGLKLSVVDGNIVVKNEQDETLAVLNDVIAEENIKTAILADNTTDGLIQQVINQVPAGADGKSAYQIWQESDSANSSLTEEDFLLSLKGETGAQGPSGLSGQDGLSIKFVGRLIQPQNIIESSPSSNEETFPNRVTLEDGTQHDPVEGDLVITHTSVLQYFDGTNWNDYGSIKGDEGPTGPEGPQGNDGTSPTATSVAAELSSDSSFVTDVSVELSSMGSLVADIKDSLAEDAPFTESITTNLKSDIDFVSATRGEQGLPGQDANNSLISITLASDNTFINNIAASGTLTSSLSTVLKADTDFQLATKGDQGNIGPQGERGLDGAAGVNGKTAFEIWKEETGASETATYAEFITAITGPEGPTGPTGDTGATGPQGETGLQGPTGPEGPVGATGQDGLSIVFKGRTQNVELTEPPSNPDTVYINGSEYVPVRGDLVINPSSELQYYNGTSWENFGSIKGDQGLKGDTGETGATGPVGPQGPIGLTGAVGPQGPQGNPGINGQDGATGPQGEIGPTGPIGLTGPTGATGAVGPVGPAGPQGERGPEGPQGPVGPTGLQGVAGTGINFKGAVSLETNLPTDAVQGDAYLVQDDDSLHIHDGTTFQNGGSIQGPQGPKGDTGLQGPTGPQGPIGATGSTGPQGETGPQGPQGETGLTGPQGLPGQDGVNGLSAYEIWTAAGNSGDESIFLSSLIGQTGAPGTDGEDGPQGPAGLDGQDGLSAYEVWLEANNTGSESDFLASLIGQAGATGPQGPEGPQGETGPQGPTGATGATGPQGETGATGSQGLSAYQVWLNEGNTGSESDFLISLKGETGATGATGATGPQGPIGNTGPQGDQGPIGQTGATGATGPQGAQGPTGPQGATGATGAQGEQGPVGPAGATGAQGPQGETGAQGPAGEDADNAVIATSLSTNSTFVSSVGANSTLASNVATVLGTSSTITALQSEIDGTQSGAGLGTDGSYTANSSSNYISSASSLKNADELLDAKIKANATAIGSNDSDISSLQTEASNVIGAVGLDTDGSYIARTNTYYLNTADSISQEITFLDARVKVNNSLAIEIRDTRDGGLLMETDALGVYMPDTIMLSSHAGPFRIDMASMISNSGDTDYIFFAGKSYQLQDRHFSVDITTGDITFTGTTLL